MAASARQWAVLLALGALAGCLAGEDPLPPAEALARAAERIDALLSEERPTGRPAQAQDRPADRREVTFWFPSHPLMAQLISRPRLTDDFNARHATARLKHHYIGDWHVAVQKLVVSMAAGDLPDIALVDRAWLARLAGSGRIAALDELLPQWLLEDLRAPSRDAFTVQGHLYAFPPDGFCSVLVYDLERAGDAAPRTWDDLRRTTERVAPPPKPGDTRPVYALGHLPFMESLWSAGGAVCRDAVCGLNAPQAHEALEFLLGLRRDGLLDPRTLGRPAAALDRFVAGAVRMTVTSSEHLPRVRKAPFPVGVAPVPGKGGPVSRHGAMALVVFRKHAQAKRAAIADVLAFLTGPELQGADALERGSLPVRTSVAEGLAAPSALEAAYACAKGPPLVGAWGSIEFELTRYLTLTYAYDPASAPAP